MPTSLLLSLALPAFSALSPVAEKQLDAGLKHLYAAEYDESRAAFRKIVEAEPDNPFGYLFEAGAIWWQTAAELTVLTDTPTLQGLFEQDVEAAIRKAEEWTDSKDRTLKVDGHFVAGMAYGTQGQWHVMRRQWIRAYLDGRKAMKHLKKCAKLDPDYYDVNLGLGVFDYQAARFSGFIKLAGGLAGMRGDEERGIARIRLAMERGRFASRQAAQFLSSIYIVDKDDWENAAPIVERLRREFPDSPYFHFLDVISKERHGDMAGSLAEARALFERVRRDPSAFERKQLTFVCNLRSDACLPPRVVDAAHAWFSRALELEAKGKPAPGRPAWLSTLRLGRGFCADMLGRREEAAADYQAVLAGPDFGANKERAAACLKQACSASDVLDDLRRRAARR